MEGTTLWRKYRKGWPLLLAASLLFFVFSPLMVAQGVAPDDLQVLLSDSRPSTVANWTVTHDQVSSAQYTSGDTLVLTIPSGFSIGSVDDTDIDFKVASTDETLQTGACGATDTVRYTRSGQVMTFEACSSYTAEAAGSIIEIEIGLHATFTTTGDQQITNNTANTYQVTSDTTDEDAKDAAIVILSGVTMSATVDETLTHTVAGVTTANCPNPAGAGSETEIDTSGGATTVPFGTVNTNTFYGACQQHTIGTNAQLGYSTTVKTTTRPTSGSNVISEGTCDGSCTDTTEAAWATNTNYGYGYCASDSTGDAAATADSGWSSANNGCNSSGTTFFKTINRADASELGQAFMASAVPVSGDISYIKYRLTVGPAQSAGTYQTTIVYVTTGTF